MTAILKDGSATIQPKKVFVTHLSANCSLECEWMFAKKNTKESLKAWHAIKCVVNMHNKDAKETTQHKVTLFFQALFTNVTPTSRYDVTKQVRYDVNGLELTVWPETSVHSQLQMPAKITCVIS